MSKQRHDALVAEFMRDQLWQFISIDEWLDAHRESETSTELSTETGVVNA